VSGGDVERLERELAAVRARMDAALKKRRTKRADEALAVAHDQESAAERALAAARGEEYARTDAGVRERVILVGVVLPASAKAATQRTIEAILELAQSPSRSPLPAIARGRFPVMTRTASS
jgi:hypothetical protein